MQQEIIIEGLHMRDLRYGENPHQTPAALYATNLGDPLALHRFEVIEGEPGFINLTDVDRALTTLNQIVAAFEHNYHTRPYVAVGLKHGNACGAGVADTDERAIRAMVAGQPQDLHGGVVMTNFPVVDVCAELLTHYKMPEDTRRILDVIVAPDITDEAKAVLHRNKERCKMLLNPILGSLGMATLRQGRLIRPVRGGFLIQPAPSFMMDFNHPELVRHGKATPEQEACMLLGWAIGSTSNSNTITLVRTNEYATWLMANGVGQQSRVGGGRLAVDRAHMAGAGSILPESIAYSDSFFPFPDGPEVLMSKGVRAIFATSGSINDKVVIACCEERNVPLYLIPDKLGRGFFGH